MIVSPADAIIFAGRYTAATPFGMAFRDFDATRCWAAHAAAAAASFRQPLIAASADADASRTSRFSPICQGCTRRRRRFPGFRQLHAVIAHFSGRNAAADRRRQPIRRSHKGRRLPGRHACALLMPPLPSAAIYFVRCRHDTPLMKATRPRWLIAPPMLSMPPY